METTKLFKSIKDFANSNPSKEVEEKVLAFVNRGVISQSRILLRDKKAELVKLEKLGKTIKESGLTIGKDYTDKVNGVKKEIKDLESLIPKKEEKTEEQLKEESKN